MCLGLLVEMVALNAVLACVGKNPLEPEHFLPESFWVMVKALEFFEW